jgi:hypothetical protein
MVRSDRQRLDQLFGLWRARPEAALAVQERLRREWDRA